MGNGKNKNKNTKKEVAAGAVSIATTTAATAIGTVGSAAMFAGIAALFGVLRSALAERDNEHAQKMFRRMADTDEDPEDFIALINERLRVGDDEMLVKLRALIRADLESASSDAMVPIARLGHAYVRGKAAAWAARAWVRLLSEATGPELDALQVLADGCVRVAAAVEARQRSQREAVAPFRATFVLGSPQAAVPTYSPARGESISISHPDFYPFNSGYAGVESEHSSRLFDLMLQHGVATDREDLVHHTRPRLSQTRDHEARFGEGIPPRPALSLAPASVDALIRAFGAGGDAGGDRSP
jgi:hypothetical protein